MSKPVEALPAHPAGEQSSVEFLPEAVGLDADTFGGRVHVEWDPTAAATPLGQLPFFIEFLKLGGLLAQLYRDRAAGENNFDELKNHWGWGGFTTRDLQRCRLIARIVALIYNWWTLFVRLADPDQHTEAITSRPLLLYAVGRQTRHANQTSITITSTHGKAGRVRRMLAEVAAFFTSLRPMAEQLTDPRPPPRKTRR